VSRGKGAGAPIYFRCWYCRRHHTGRHWGNCGSVQGVSFTWRKRTYYSNPGSARRSRTAPIQVQYRCGCCAWVGWSAHFTLVARYAGEL